MQGSDKSCWSPPSPVVLSMLTILLLHAFTHSDGIIFTIVFVLLDQVGISTTKLVFYSISFIYLSSVRLGGTAWTSLAYRLTPVLSSVLIPHNPIYPPRLVSACRFTYGLFSSQFILSFASSIHPRMTSIFLQLTANASSASI